MTVAAANLPSNKAQGGAIYSLCLEAYNQECAVKLVGNVFENNVADDAGGATIWLNKPFIETETSDEDGGTDADDAGGRKVARRQFAHQRVENSPRHAPSH